MTKAEGTCKQQASSSTSTANDSNLPSSSSGKSGNTTPKDGQIIAAILKEMSIFEYEPRIIHQMIEFTYSKLNFYKKNTDLTNLFSTGYVSNVLEDAQMFSSYAKKKTIDPEDVQLAIQLQVDRSFANPPPRDLLLEIARQKNNQPLPPIKSHNGPRLPADRYSLVACNYKLKSAKSKPQGI